MSVRAVSIKVFKDFCTVAGILAMFGIAGFLMLPVVLKSGLPQLIEQATGRKAAVKKIEFNPVFMRLSLQGFSLSEPGGKPFADFDNLTVDLDVWRSLKESALVIERVLLNKPVVRIAKQKDGRFNFNDLLKSKDETRQEDNPLFPLTIDNISLSEGKLAWADAHFGEPVSEEIYPINLAIQKVSLHDNKPFPINLSLTLKSGAKLDWRGIAGVNPVASSGHIKLDSVNLTRILELAAADTAKFDLQGTGLLELDYKVAYAKQALDLGIERSQITLQAFQFSGKESNDVKVNIQDGVLEGGYQFSYADKHWRFKAEHSKLDVNNIQLPELGKSKTVIDIPALALEAGYQVDNADNRINFVLNGSALDIKNTNLTELGQNAPLVKIPGFSANGIAFDLAKQAFSVDAVKADNADIKAWLTAEGKINYLSLLLPVTGAEENATATPDKAPAPEESAWKISVKKIELNNAAFAFEDRTLAKTASVHAKPINIKLDNVTNQAGASVPVEFNTGINETGSIKFAGDAVINPFSARLLVDISDIDLEGIQPYIDKFARLDLLDGRWNATGKLAIALPANDKPELTFKGNTGIAGLLTRDQILNKDFVKWKNLSFQDIEADVTANRYTAKKLIIEKPYARVVIAKDKSVNVNDVFTTAKTRSAGSASNKKADNPKQDRPYFKLDRIQVIDGSSDFADLSLILPFAAHIKSLDGGATGVSSEKKSTIKMALKGDAYDLSPVDIQGVISPYQGDFNVEMNFQGMPMPLVSPYMVQFAGYKVEKGKLTLGLKYKVENRQLTASNSILIDQFELGEKVENPNAVSVPLELAVALLKDSNGRIKLDVPISGSLEDPKFSLGKIIGEALLNSISKIITSPFKAIAALIGSEENFSVVSFAPGKSELDAKQLKKLDELIKLLKERTVLTFEIKGAAFQEDDWPALREAALYDQLKKQKAAELAKNGGKKILAEYVELSDKEYKRLLADKFIEKFPLLADKSLFGTPRLLQPEAGDFYVVAKQKLAAMIKPEENRLKHLAEERAQVIAKYIVQKGGISNNRIFILDTAIDPERDSKEIVARLSLKTN